MTADGRTLDARFAPQGAAAYELTWGASAPMSGARWSSTRREAIYDRRDVIERFDDRPAVMLRLKKHGDGGDDRFRRSSDRRRRTCADTTARVLVGLMGRRCTLVVPRHRHRMLSGMPGHKPWRIHRTRMEQRQRLPTERR